MSEPRVRDRVVTLLGDNDCDENDRPRIAPPGATGTVVTIEGGRFHVVFDGGVWVVLERSEICDPGLYTWEPKENT